MNQYEKQANDFLEKTKTTLTVKLSDNQKIPKWENDGINADRHLHYIVTLTNAKYSYTFDYWGSVADWEKVHQYRHESGRRFLELNKVKPTAYSILACIHPYFGSFDDFCLDFGYNSDSIKDMEIYLEVVKQTIELSKLFTPIELETLQEIN